MILLMSFMNDIMLFDIISVSLTKFVEIVLVGNVTGLLLTLRVLLVLLEILKFVLLVVTLISLPLQFLVKMILCVLIVLIILVVWVSDPVELLLIL